MYWYIGKIINNQQIHETAHHFPPRQAFLYLLAEQLPGVFPLAGRRLEELKIHG